MLLGDGLAQIIECYHKDKSNHGDLALSATTRNEEKDDRRKPIDAAATAVTSILSSYDPFRGGIMISWAAVGDVPITLALFSMVERAMKHLGIPAMASFPQSALKAVCLFVPGTLIRMPCFMAYVTSMEHLTRNLQVGRPLTQDWDQCVSTIQSKMTNDLYTIINNGAKVWVPINTFFFYMVPTEFRTIGISFVAVGWMTYLSLMQHKQEPPTGAVLPGPTVVKEPATTSPKVC
jgi:Mpv17 / PMP22 family